MHPCRVRPFTFIYLPFFFFLFFNLFVLFYVWPAVFWCLHMITHIHFAYLRQCCYPKTYQIVHEFATFCLFVCLSTSVNSPNCFIASSVLFQNHETYCWKFCASTHTYTRILSEMHTFNMIWSMIISVALAMISSKWSVVYIWAFLAGSPKPHGATF